MPNSDNILAPLTIVGNGRSGTSLVSRMLNLHSACSFAGETVNLIHSVWKSMESSLPAGKQPQIPEVIRKQFLEFFPSPTPHWMHKPIGIPIVWRFFPGEDEFYDWFWEVLEAVFPQAKYFTVLRHPLDVVSSSHRWWGWSMESIIESNRMVARLITHPRSQVEFAVNYHQLVDDPEPQTRRLLEYLGLAFEPRCLEAFDVGHVMTSQQATPAKQDLSRRKQDSFSHKQAWHEIGPERVHADYRDAVDACWARFGYDFGGWPRDWAGLEPAEDL